MWWCQFHIICRSWLSNGWFSRHLVARLSFPTCRMILPSETVLYQRQPFSLNSYKARIIYDGACAMQIWDWSVSRAFFWSFSWKWRRRQMWITEICFSGRGVIDNRRVPEEYCKTVGSSTRYTFLWRAEHGDCASSKDLALEVSLSNL